MNLTLKTKFLFALFAGLVFATINSSINYLFQGKSFEIARFGFDLVYFGLLFGFGFLYFMKRYSDKMLKKISVALNDGEVIEHEGAANLFRGMEAVGGKLMLTNKRLVFKSHKLNIQSGETSLELGEINEVIPRKTAYLLNNGIRMMKVSGEHFDFVVYERQDWLSKINEALKAQHH
jgi:hypothetical protein